jgi:hypothetical protein
MKQRIALVAVSVLTAGLFSVVSTPVANAAVAQASTFALAISNSTTGTNVVTAGGGDTSLDKSIGFVALTSANNVSTISNTALTTNVATITTAAAHGYAVGNSVTVAAGTATSLNGTFTIASVPSTTTFTYAKTTTDVATGVDTGTVRTGGQQAIGSTAVELSAGVTGTAVALSSARLVFNVAGGAITDRVALSVTNGTVSSRSSATIASTIADAETDSIVITATGHGLLVGDLVTFDTVTNGMDVATATAITAVTTNTFTIAKAGLVAANAATEAGVVTLAEASPFNTSNTAAYRSNGKNPVLAAVVTPNSGATTMTVRAYKGTAITAADVSTGTLLGTWSITIVAAGTTSTFSPALSLVALQTSTAAQITSSVDASTGSIGAGTPYYIQVIGKNAYSEALAGGSYVATATNGATLNWGDSAAGATIVAGTLSVATKTPDGTDQLRIDPASSLTTTSTTVTITHDGLPVATKTMTFYGEAKKIVIEKVVPGTTSTAISSNLATAYAIYSYRDSADGKVPGAHANFVATVANSTVPSGASNRQPSRSTGAAGSSASLAAAQVTLIGTLQDGVFAFSCGSTPGKAKGTITHTNAITGTVLTAEAEVGCYGPISTYTVSTDKASYAVGEVATITVEGKDVAGNPVSDAQLLGASTISVGGGTLTTGATGAADVFTAGKAKYTAQMTTAGTFNTVVSIVALVTTSATTSYKVSDGGVTNAEVLKSIVALIASINKQIAALQKLILARR